LLEVEVGEFGEVAREEADVGLLSLDGGGDLDGDVDLLDDLGRLLRTAVLLNNG